MLLYCSQRYFIGRSGEAAWAQVLAAAQLPGTTFLSSKAYEDPAVYR